MQVTKIWKGIGIIWFTAFSSVVTASDIATLPLPFIAKYEAFRHDNDIGTAELSLTAKSNNEFELKYHSKVSRFFLSDKRYETSVFSFTDGKITPISYDFVRKGTGPNKSLSAKFDKPSQTIILDDMDDVKWEGEIDNQLFRIDISMQLALGKETFEYEFLNYRGQKRNYKIEVANKEIIKLPYGSIEAIKVQVNRDNNKRQTYAWFAPSLNFVLVRLQQFKDGDEQGDIRLKTYQEL